MKHFKYLFEIPDGFQIFRNTLVIALGKIVLGTIMAIIFSILLNEIRVKWMKKSIQTIVYLPHFLSWVVLAAAIKKSVWAGWLCECNFRYKLKFYGKQHAVPASSDRD